MRRNRNNWSRNGGGGRAVREEITEQELDELLAADLKLSIFDDICVSEDLIERTLAAAKRGDEPRTPPGKEEDVFTGENPDVKKYNLPRVGRNMAAAAAVLVILLAGSYAFTNFLSGSKKSADNAAGGAAPQATMAATAAVQEDKAGTEREAEAGAADGCLPETTAGTAAESADKAPAPNNKEERKSGNAVLTSLSGLAFCARALGEADAVTVSGEETGEVTLTGDQVDRLSQVFLEAAGTAVQNSKDNGGGTEDEKQESSLEYPVWVITAFSGEDARLRIEVGEKITVSLMNEKEWEKDGEYLIEDLQTLADLLSSFL